MENDRNIVIFNAQRYKVEIYLYNFTTDPIPILWGGVKQLVLEEDIHSWWVRGTIILENAYSSLERPASDSKLDKQMAYTFRNDCRDIIGIKMIPVFEEFPELELNKECWEFDYQFAIYDVEELTGNSPQEKCKKLYFWEIEYQQLLEKNSEWSSTEVFSTDFYKKDKIHPAQINDEGRKVYTGHCIKHILENNLLNQTFDGDWDIGSSKIFYTSPAKNNVIDDLNYLMRHHVSQIDNDFCIISRNRNSKTWTLKPVSWYFKNSTIKDSSQAMPGILTFEKFTVEYPDADNSGITVPKSPHVKGNPIMDIDANFGDFSIVRNYKYVDMAGIDNMKALVNRPVYSENMTDGRFNIDFGENMVENVKEVVRNNYSKHFVQKNNINVSLTMNNSKVNMYNTEPSYSFSKEPIERYAFGRNMLLKSSIFLNACISFSVKGMVNRTSGKFFSLEKDVGNTDNNYDNKVLGTWFCVSVRHHFVGNMYINEITGVKIQPYEDININERIG